MSGKIIDSEGEAWRPIVRMDERSALCAELSKEIHDNPKHQLFGKSLCFVGRRGSEDDFLIVLDEGLVGIVHLTYKQERDPAWPHFSGNDERLTPTFISAFDLDWDGLDFLMVE